MSRPNSLHAPFKSAQPELQRYVIALEKANRKLEQQIARLQVDSMTKQHRITALNTQIKKLTKNHGLTINMNL